jgi:tetratricopeptide (TPR) repeat protein
MRKGPNWTVCSLALIFVFGSSLVVRAQSQGNNSEAAVSLNNQGLQLFQQGKVDEAIVQYRRALAIRPDFPEALSNLGLALDAKGNDVEALTDFDKALTLKPGRRRNREQPGPRVLSRRKIRRISRGLPAGYFV